MAAKQIRRLPVLWLSQWGAVRFSRASSLSMQHTLNAPAVLSQRSQRVRQTFSKCFCSMTFTFFFYVLWTNTRAAAPPYKIIIKATITQLFSFKINTSTLCWSWCLFVKWCLFVHCSQPKLHVLALSNLSWAGTTLYVTHKLKERYYLLLDYWIGRCVSDTLLMWFFGLWHLCWFHIVQPVNGYTGRAFHGDASSSSDLYIQQRWKSKLSSSTELVKNSNSCKILF